MAVLFYIMAFVSIFQIVFATLFIVALMFRLYNNKKSVCIIVLGDIGRSPRMQYHAASYAKENFFVHLVGFHGSKLIPELCNNPKVKCMYLIQFPKRFPFLPSILHYILKTLFMSLQLLVLLFFVIGKPNLFLIQNPPSIPAMSITWFVSQIKGCKYIVDWHNYGYTIMALNLKSENHPLVQLSYFYERIFGWFSDENICVTKAMQANLLNNWGISAKVLYDKPPDTFKETSLDEKHELYFKLLRDGLCVFQGADENSTVFTQFDGESVVLKQNRPAIVISSTSWTEDEDFSILLAALERYEQIVSLNHNLPNLICIITGKGPLKDYYMEEINKKSFQSIQIITPWLSPEDYPKVIGSGDLGVCLHTSSSGLDLPMKVVDMFGCGLPVCAVSFSCLDELVKHDDNGLVFTNSMELSEQLVSLLDGFPDECHQLQEMRRNLKEFQKLRWHANWEQVVLPIS